MKKDNPSLQLVWHFCDAGGLSELWHWLSGPVVSLFPLPELCKGIYTSIFRSGNIYHYNTAYSAALPYRYPFYPTRETLAIE
jgi:hypothetical protein